MEERLQKLIANAGIDSRRHAEELIRSGQVIVNGNTVTKLGAKADPERDHIKVGGRLINPLLRQGDKVYVLLYKPKGYLTSLSDPKRRPLVSELIPSSFGRLHPVGRLDFNTEGLLILTNDGELTNYLTAARNQVEKSYEVKVKGVPGEAAIDRLRRGLKLSDRKHTAPAKIRKLRETHTNAWYEVVLHQGRNQQIRRMFDSIGHSVLKLRRVAIGPIREAQLKPGNWRLLRPVEIKRLRGNGASGKATGSKHRSSARSRSDTRTVR